MAQLEAVLRISAQDDTAKALASIKEKILGIEKTAVQLDKFVTAVGRVTRSTDPLASSLINAEKALASQRNEISGVVAGLDRLTGPTDRAAAAQRNLARQVEATTGAMARQGETAVRATERASSAARRGAGGAAGGMGGHGLGGMLPFAGPELSQGVKANFHAGATVEEQLARLKAAGVTGPDIDKARGGYREFSKKHAGVLEADYLGFFKDATTIAPGESHEMAELGALYKTSLRNSGISSTDYDVGNVLRIMDELGLKSQGDRVGFLDNFLKSQQAFGSQISTETALAAYRNAKQSIYGWSPEFRDKFFPTLLQSSGQQGGTEMMTSLNNYIGGHMSHAELQALADNGFVDSKDLMTNKNGDIKGLKKGAKLFEADKFKSNIAEWSWDFHDEYMKRKDSTEGGFDDLIAKMPRNMAGLIAFLNHNRERIQRDAQTLEKPVGLKAGDNSFLADNPVAGLEALKNSIEQFAAAVSGPSMGEVGKGLESMAQGIQSIAASYGDWAKKNPDVAKDVGVGVGAAGAAGAGWLSWKLLSGVGSFLGFGGGAAEGAGGAAAAGGGLLAGGPFAALAAIGYELGNPDSFIRKWMDKNINSHPGVKAGSDWATTGDWRTRVAYGRQAEDHPMLYGVRDMEGARGRAMMGLGEQHGPVQAETIVHGDATISGVIRVEAGSQLLSIVNEALQIKQTVALNPVQGGHGGRMDSDAAPLGRGGIGSR